MNIVRSMPASALYVEALPLIGARSLYYPGIWIRYISESRRFHPASAEVIISCVGIPVCLILFKIDDGGSRGDKQRYDTHKIYGYFRRPAVCHDTGENHVKTAAYRFQPPRTYRWRNMDIKKVWRKETPAVSDCGTG